MSKLLKENQVRRFMKLASIGSLSEGFLDTEEEVEEGMGHYSRDEGDEPVMEEEEMEMDADVEEADPDADIDTDMEMDAEGGAGLEGEVMDIITTITNALEQEYPYLDIDVSKDAEEGADLDAPEDLEGGEEEGLEGDEEEIEGVPEVVDDDEIIAEVLKRVTKRLRNVLQKNKIR